MTATRTRSKIYQGCRSPHQISLAGFVDVAEVQARGFRGKQRGPCPAKTKRSFPGARLSSRSAHSSRSGRFFCGECARNRERRALGTRKFPAAAGLAQMIKIEPGSDHMTAGMIEAEHLLRKCFFNGGMWKRCPATMR